MLGVLVLIFVRLNVIILSDFLSVTLLSAVRLSADWAYAKCHCAESCYDKCNIAFRFMCKLGFKCSSQFESEVQAKVQKMEKSGNTKWGSITVLLTSCLTALD